MRFFHLNLVSLIFCACPTPKWQKAGESSSLKYATNVIGHDGNEVGEMQVKMIVKQVCYLAPLSQREIIQILKYRTNRRVCQNQQLI